MPPYFGQLEAFHPRSYKYHEHVQLISDPAKYGYMCNDISEKQKADFLTKKTASLLIVLY